MSPRHVRLVPGADITSASWLHEEKILSPWQLGSDPYVCRAPGDEVHWTG